MLLPALAGAVLAAQAAETPPLPEPLTLDHALSLAGDLHPEVAILEAERGLAQAGQLAAEAATGLSADILARARFVEPHKRTQNPTRHDHAVSLVLRKPLYDFGRSSARRAAASAALEGAESAVIAARQAQRISIMQRFFDVLLADLRYARDAEATAVAFARFDRAKERMALGQRAEIDVWDLEEAYRRARRLRAEGQAEQRATRARLALALNRPGELSSELAVPELPSNRRQRPEHAVLERAALAGNPRLSALRAQVEAAEHRVDAVRAEDNAILRAEAQAAAGTRVTASNDRWRAGIALEIPLSTGGRQDAKLAARRADLAKARAELAGAEMVVREAILEAWLALDTLAMQREEAHALSEYRDRYLDRSRAEYELELRTDLGDAMVQTSTARLRRAETEYAIALTWARIDALTGVEPEHLGRGGAEIAPEANGGEVTP